MEGIFGFVYINIFFKKKKPTCSANNFFKCKLDSRVLKASLNPMN